MRIKEMLVNGNVAVSISQDQTVFIFTILQSSNGILLEPVGFVPVNSFIDQITCITWEADLVLVKKRFLSANSVKKFNRSQ